MADSVRRTLGNQTPYRNTAIDAALGREAHREQTEAARATRVNGSTAAAASYVTDGREAQAETLVSAIPREAHLETVGATAPRATVSVTALQRLGGLLRRDENLARKLARNPQRALAALDFISDRDKQVLAGINPQFWSQVAAVSDDFQAAKSKRAMAGLADAPFSPAVGGVGGGDSPYGWGGIGTPDSPGINVGNGVVVHPGGRGQAPQGAPGDDGGGLGIVDYGFGHGNAGDPNVVGHQFGGRGGGSGGGGGRFNDPLGYTAIGMHGEGGGTSGGRLPSRAVLAGRAWRALNPGGDVSDDDHPLGGGAISKDPYEDPAKKSADEAALAQADAEKKAKDASGEVAIAVLTGALLGGALGAVFGGGYLGGAVGAVGVGGFAGWAAHERLGRGPNHLWTPADTDLTGGGGGPAGPRSRETSRFVQMSRSGNEAFPNEFATGTTPGGPRSVGVDAAFRSVDGEAIPNDFGNGVGPGPRSRHTLRDWKARSGLEAFPNDEGTGGTGPVGPSSRAL